MTRLASAGAGEVGDVVFGEDAPLAEAEARICPDHLAAAVAGRPLQQRGHPITVRWLPSTSNSASVPPPSRLLPGLSFPPGPYTNGLT